MEIFIIIAFILLFISFGNHSTWQHYYDERRNESLKDIARSNEEISKAIYNNLFYQKEKDAEEKRLKFKRTLKIYKEM